MTTRSTTLVEDYTLTAQPTSWISGIRITVDSTDIKLTKVTVMSSVTANKAYLYNSDGSSLLASADISSLEATFNYTLSASTTYHVKVGNPDNTWTTSRDNGLSFPIDMTEVSFISGVQATNSLDTARAWNIASLDLEAVSSGTTVNPSTLTTSTSQTAPSYFIDITAGAVDMTSTIQAPGILGIPVTVDATSIGFSTALLDPTVITPISITLYPSVLELEIDATSVVWDSRIYWTSSQRGITSSWPKQEKTVTNLVYKKSYIPKGKKIGL